MKNVLEYLERSARLYPDKTAFEDLNQKITYAQLKKRAKAIGSALAEKHAPRSPIAVWKKASIRSRCCLALPMPDAFMS